jgi:hypothetical protein
MERSRLRRYACDRIIASIARRGARKGLVAVLEMMKLRKPLN